VGREIEFDYLPCLETFNESPAKYRGLHGGRGSGKSHNFATLATDRCTEKRTDIVCVREYQRSLKQSAKRLIENKIEHYGLGKDFEVQQTQIKAPHGGLVIFEGLQDHTAESIKSFEDFNVFWIEEAQSLSARSLELLIPTMRAKDGEIWASWNPRFDTDPIDILLRGDDPPPDAIVREINYDENIWFPEILRKELEYDRRRDPEKYQHVWLGGYLRNSEARVFKNWKIEEFEANVDETFRLGADWGFSLDPTVLIRCFIVGRTLYIDHEAYEVGCEIENIPILFQSIPDSERWPIVADNNRPDTIDFVRRHGYPKIYGAAKGKGSIEDGIEWLKNFDIIVHPRCKHTIDELTMYSYKVDKDTGKVLPILADKHNHVIDALRYANEGYRRAQSSQPVTLEFDSEW
jgi:phage terminase large subunit